MFYIKASSTGIWCTFILIIFGFLTVGNGKVLKDHQFDALFQSLLSHCDLSLESNKKPVLYCKEAELITIDKHN